MVCIFMHGMHGAFFRRLTAVRQRPSTDLEHLCLLAHLRAKETFQSRPLIIKTKFTEV